MWDCITYTHGWVGVIIGGSYHQYWHSMPVECGLSISPQTLPYLPHLQADTHAMAQMSNCFWLAIQCCNNIKWFNVTQRVAVGGNDGVMLCHRALFGGYCCKTLSTKLDHISSTAQTVLLEAPHAAWELNCLVYNISLCVHTYTLFHIWNLQCV